MLIREINKWLLLNKFYTTAEMAENGEFSYNLGDNLIKCGFIGGKEEDKIWDALWEKFCETLGGFNPSIPIWVRSFLHELGHSETLEDFENDELLNDLTQRSLIGCIIDTEERSKAYFNLETERLATLWAIDYSKRNPVAVEELINIFNAERMGT